MKKGSANFLTVRVGFGEVYVGMDWIQVIEECPNVKSLPRLKSHIDGITIFNNEILPVVRIDDCRTTSFKTLVIRDGSSRFMLKISNVSSIAQITLNDFEHDELPFIVKSGDRRFVDIEAISRHLN